MNAAVDFPGFRSYTRRVTSEDVTPPRPACDSMAGYHEEAIGKRLSAILPSLRADDPVVQYLGLSVGDVVRIDRPDGSIYYRLVIACKQ